MGYLEKTMSQGEAVLGRATFHWSYTLAANLLLLFGVGLGVAIWRYAPEGSEWRWAAVAVGVLFLLAFLKLMIDKWTTEIAVTNRRFLYKRGWISRTTQELPMHRVEEVNLEQSVFGRLFGYGRLRVHGTGGDVPIEVPTIDSPLDLRRALVEASGRAAAPPAAAARTDAPA